MRMRFKTLAFFSGLFLVPLLSTAGPRIVLGEYFTGTW